MTSPQYQGVIFDFDGTLADSYAAITASVNHVRTTYGLPPLPEPDVRRRVGFGLLTLMAEIVPGVDPATAAQVYRAHHRGVMLTHTRLLPGVADALAALDRRGVRMAVCSNKAVEFTRKLVEALGIARHFKAVLGPEDAGAPKPDPAMIHQALRLLELVPAECLYVGDMTVDVETAHNAGLAVWVVPSGSNDLATLQAAGPDRILADLGELPTALLGG